MKKSELKEYIKEQIVKMLSEAPQKTTIDYKNPAMSDKVLDIDPTDTATINKLKSDPNVNSIAMGSKKIKEAKKDEEDVEVKDDYYKVEDEDGDKDKGPTKSELKNIAKTTKGIAKAKDELARLTKEMKSLGKKYKEAEGAEKEKMLADLRKKTDLKKELEAIVFPKEK
jgi:hypothetical protein